MKYKNSTLQQIVTVIRCYVIIYDNILFGFTFHSQKFTIKKFY